MAEHRPADACGGVLPGKAEQATALLALWNDVDPALEVEYEAWHAGEHVPERLTVPGMLWARRYGRQAPPRYLTLYGLRDAAVLEGEAYQRLLREPTPMSRRMRPALRNVSRWLCGLVEARGLEQGAGLVAWTADSADGGASGGPGRVRMRCGAGWWRSGWRRPARCPGCRRGRAGASRGGGCWRLWWMGAVPGRRRCMRACRWAWLAREPGLGRSAAGRSGRGSEVCVRSASELNRNHPDRGGPRWRTPP